MTFDPFVPEFADDPYPYYAKLRAAAPAYQHPHGFWILSRYDDVAKLPRAGHSVDERYMQRTPSWKRDSTVPATENRPMRGMSMLDQDPPNHSRLRHLVSRAFTRHTIDGLRPRIETLVDEGLDRLAARGSADIIAELAFPLPFTVISEMLGAPAMEHARLRELAGVLVRSLEPLPDAQLLAAVRASNHELTEIARDMIRWKRKHPGDDLITALIAARYDGDMLTEDELIAQIMFLYLAGHETTVNLLAGGICALARNPDQARLLRDRPDLASNAVEELLRYDSAVHMLRRINRAPISVAGIEIPPGSFVIGALAAANRDPEFWGSTADDVRVDRPNAHQHLSFGAGPHHCLGAALARLEARVAFTAFVRRFADPVVEEARWNGRINIRGLATLTMRVR